MRVKATIKIDDDRWCKTPYSLEFDDPECDAKFGVDWSKTSKPISEAIQNARNAGYEVEVVEVHY